MKETENELSSDKFQQSLGIWKGRDMHRLVTQKGNHPEEAPAQQEEGEGNEGAKNQGF